MTPTPEWDSSTRPLWLVELVDRLENRRVERVRTQPARAWHHCDRQVLHVRRATDGAYAMIAGALPPPCDASNPPSVVVAT